MARREEGLVRYTRAFLDGTRLPPPFSADPFYLERLFVEADHEGVGPLLAYSLRDEPRLHSAHLERLETEWRRAKGRSLHAAESLRSLLEAFRVAGIRAIPLKGPLLAERLYPDPALRPTSDLDLLIGKADLHRVDELLVRLGYRRAPDAHTFEFDVAYDRATFYTHAEMLPVDLHWDLLSSESFARGSRVIVDEVWERVVSADFAGVEGATLCDEDLLVYLALHLAVHHACSGLIWLLDIALLLDQRGERMNWEAVVERARRWRVMRALFFALESVRGCYGRSAPESVRREFRPRDPRGALMSWLLRRAGLRRLDHLIPLLLIERGRDLIGPLRHAMVPSPGWVRARYGHDGAGLLRCYGRHVKRAARIFARLGGGMSTRERV